jgi:CubicO group peptidase (beta-lactamase class C family)
MIRYIAFLTAALFLTVSCSGGSDTETAQVATSSPTATVEQPTSTPTPTPTQVPPTPTPTPTQVLPTPTPTPTPIPTATPSPTPTPTPTQVPSTAIPVLPTPTATAMPRRTNLQSLAKDPAPDFTSSSLEGSFSASVSLALSMALESEFEATSEKMGISAAVYKPGKSWSEAVGLAAEGIPMTPDTPLRLMSTSKTFLAALVLKQIEDGLYSLDDRISTLLPNHSSYQSLDVSVIPDATIRDLLLMRAGILGEHGDSGKMGLFRVMADPNWEPVDTLQLLTKPARAPGEYQYSPIANSYLLGLVAEEMGNSDLLTLYRTELVNPLNIEIGLLPVTETPPSLAKSYAERSLYGGQPGFGDITKIEIYTSYGLDYHQADGRLSWAGAGIMSTPTNIAQWVYELMSPNGSAVSPEVTTKLTESFVDEWIVMTESRQKYGFHVTLTEHYLNDGKTILSYGHPGGGSGFASSILYVPSLDLGISIIANTEINFVTGSCESTTEGGGPKLKYGLNPMSCIALSFLETLIVDNAASGY